jgi:LemA protein
MGRATQAVPSILVQGLAIGGAVIVLLLLAVALSYNAFVRQRQLVESSWSNVDTELRRRYDLIPNLVATVQGYAAHERATLEEVTEARRQAVASTGEPEDQARQENVLVGTLRQLLAVSEAYPDLKADAHFLELQRELVNTEDRIQAARRFFNANVRSYNRRVESVPSNLVASAFGFSRRSYFEIEPAVREDGAPAVHLKGTPEVSGPD